MKNQDLGGWVGIAAFFSVMVVGIGGWIVNIVKLSSMAADPLTTMFVMRIIGIFVAPLGSVLGFM